jgi:hypothetical protein
LNNQGTQGLQFAAVGGAAYHLAKAKGLGHALPLEWFTQKIRDCENSVLGDLESDPNQAPSHQYSKAPGGSMATLRYIAYLAEAC